MYQPPPFPFQASNYLILYSQQSKCCFTNPTLQKDFIERIEKYLFSTIFKTSFQSINNMQQDFYLF